MATAKKAPAAKKLASNALVPTYDGQSKESMQREQQYQTEEDVRSLHKAHQIKSDPARHARAKTHIREMVKAVGRVPQMAGNAGDAAGPDSEIPQP